MKTSTKIIASAVAAVAMFFTTNVSAQNLGYGADFGVPTNHAYKFAGGLDARIQFNLTKQLSVPITSGYTRLWAKSRFWKQHTRLCLYSVENRFKILFCTKWFWSLCAG